MLADGVFSGGGIKGLAFAGALQAADEAGYTEWHQLAGTSAGAITAMALAVGYSAGQLRDTLDKFDFSKIADYGGPFGIGRVENLAVRRALTHGKVLRKWIEQLLEDAPHPVRTFGELEPEKLRVVGTDLSHGRMVVFPDDVGKYLDRDGAPFVPEQFSIAEAVRISAGFPYFFPPLSLRDAVTKKNGTLVDGGVTSSFPVFLFDSPQPQHPTWGFRLFGGSAPEQPTYNAIGGPTWPIEMLEAVIDTAINALDELEEKAFANRTVSIPTGAVPTLQFDLSDEQKTFLYESGDKTAKAFFSSKPDGRNTYGKTPSQSPSP